jgi:tetratricopeptide (TPR) repeat protein
MAVERDSSSAEPVDLPVDLQREIVDLDARLDRLTHYEALGLRRGDGADAARAAYLERVKRFHPDRYGGKRLGPFRARLDRIVRRLTMARDVLADDVRRRAYEAETALPDEVARRQVGAIEDELRAAERKARLARTNPLVVRAARVNDLVRRGKEALAAGKLAQAAADLATAAALDPRHPEAPALAAEARRRAAAERARELYEEGLRHEAAGRDDFALARFVAERELVGNDPRAATAASRAALRLGRAGDARTHAEAATRAGPAYAPAFLALGAVLAAIGERGAARQALERALELDPKLSDAKALLKKQRWSLFR